MNSQQIKKELDSINKKMDSQHKCIENRLDRLDQHAATSNAQLAEHMRRTEIAESRIMKLEYVVIVALIGIVAKILGGF